MAGGQAGVIGRAARRLASWRTAGLRFAVPLIVLLSLILGYIGLAQFLPHQPASAGYGDSWDDILFYDLQLYTFSAAPAGVRARSRPRWRSPASSPRPAPC